MPPKAVVGPDEDVKFLLTVIKQLAGTVGAPTENHSMKQFADSYLGRLAEGLRGA